jgi:hypothetical protein
MANAVAVGVVIVVVVVGGGVIVGVAVGVVALNRGGVGCPHGFKGTGGALDVGQPEQGLQPEALSRSPVKRVCVCVCVSVWVCVRDAVLTDELLMSAMCITRT